MSKKWTKDEIKRLLETNNVAVLRGMLRIYDLQTNDEKAVDETKYNNGIGFNGVDGYIMSKFSTFYNERKYLTEKQFNMAKKKIMKYAGQLTKIANNEIPEAGHFNVIIHEGWLRLKKAVNY